LAAKKVKNKDVAVVECLKMNYGPFHEDFYRAAPEVKDVGQDLLRLAMNGINIRGVNCPKTVTTWNVQLALTLTAAAMTAATRLMPITRTTCQCSC
jgi:hypothetical protein